jgi:Uma2 family endonuclease
VGTLFTSPADISWAPDTLVQPDLFVVDLEEARTLDWARMRTLLLAIEVVSPTTARRDRFTKRRLYQEARVGTYWIVDADSESVEVWTPEALFPQVVTDTLTWQPAGATEPFTLSLESLFRPL